MSARQSQTVATQEMQDLAIHVANALSICACNHCIRIYEKGKDEFLAAKAKREKKGLSI